MAKINAVKENQVVLLSGETGCGKSTQVLSVVVACARRIVRLAELRKGPVGGRGRPHAFASNLILLGSLQLGRPHQETIR